MTDEPQLWLLLDAWGDLVRGLLTNGVHPCHLPHEPPHNVMRTHPVAAMPDFTTQRWDRRARAVVDDPQMMAARDDRLRHEATLTRLSDPTMAARIALGLVSDDERAEMTDALAWKDLQSKGAK